MSVKKIDSRMWNDWFGDSKKFCEGKGKEGEKKSEMGEKKTVEVGDEGCRDNIWCK